MTKETKKVWDALNKAVAGVSVQELCTQLTLTFEEVIIAVRCIAHNHHIGLSDNDGRLILLRESNN